MMAPENSQATGRVVEMQVSGLVGPALDWAVWLAVNGEPGEACSTRKLIFTADRTYWQPSEDWSQGGPLIDRYNLSLLAPDEGFSQWSVVKEWCHGNIEATYPESPTALIAVCRAIVTANLGEVVSVPAELVEQISA
jgi:hypothetical protein